MRHYEIVFLVHPSQSEQVPAMVERYRGASKSPAARSIATRIGVAGNWPIRSTRSTRPTTFS
jgi:ribosomal protein S6